VRGREGEERGEMEMEMETEVEMDRRKREEGIILGRDSKAILACLGLHDMSCRRSTIWEIHIECLYKRKLIVVGKEGGGKGRGGRKVST
jgi:hypothetical protein